MQTSRENWIFLKRWSKHPFRLGTCFPISMAFARDVVSIAKKFIQPDDLLVELGSGTGRLTAALVEGGFQNIISVEIDSEFVALLKNRFNDVPQVRSVVHGDACVLKELLPEYHGKVALIVSVIPLMYLPYQSRKNIIDGAFEMLSPNGTCLHVCYTPISPLKREHYLAKKIYTRFRHSPPGFVWHFLSRHAA